jgi:branched-chain amino acid transport system ATP-binding protein
LAGRIAHQILSLLALDKGRQINEIIKASAGPVIHESLLELPLENLPGNLGIKEVADMAQLQIKNLHLSFGGLTALNGVSLSVNSGEIFAIIGPNGAGKTCILNCVCGFYHPDQGGITIEGQEITKFSPHKIAGLGIARTFQNIELFQGMTVLDNIKLGAHVHLKSGFLAGGFYWGKARKEEMKLRREVEEQIIDLLEIQAIRKKIVGTLPYGLQKRVELARALALRPKILLLDEPMAGMNLEETEDMARFILDINEERGVTIVLIEHDMGVVMDISDRIFVLDFGTKIAEGSPAEIQHNEHVINAYLGGTGAAFSKLGF